MQAGLTVESVADTPKEYNGEIFWQVQCGGKKYKLYVPNKPAIGQYFPCEITETQGLFKGKQVVYRDARPLTPVTPPQLAPTPQAPLPLQPIQALPTTAQKPKVSLAQIQAVILAIARDLTDWVDKTPRGAEAVASIIQTVILRIAAGEVEIGDALDDAVPADVKEIYENTRDWTDA